LALLLQMLYNFSFSKSIKILEINLLFLLSTRLKYCKFDESLMIAMTKHSELEDLKKREKIQNHFWNEVGAIEHISLPKLRNAVRNEFNYEDDRSVQAQIELMQAETRIRIESRVKVWIKPPHTNSP
jgi:hypothetical protein